MTRKDGAVDDRIEQALALGEAAIALALADAEVRATRRGGGAAHLEALRRRARLGDECVDDEDMEGLAGVARAWGQVAARDGATAADFEALAWAEMLANAPRKASKALDEAARRDPRAYDGARAAAAWVGKRDETAFTAMARAAEQADPDTLERIVRLVVQAHGDAVALAQRLVARREEQHPIWDRSVARAVRLLAGAYFVGDDRARGDAALTSWVNAVIAALPDAEDVRRLVADDARLAYAPKEQALAAREVRLARAASVFGEASPLLEAPLFALAGAATHAKAHDVAVRALERLDAILAKKKGGDVLSQRASSLMQLRRSLLALGRCDEAMAVVAREEEVAARRGNLVPDHHARAEVLEARGDLEGMVAEHLAAVAQYEAGPGPAYGPTGSNTELARGWARQALARAGRATEAEGLLGRRGR